MPRARQPRSIAALAVILFTGAAGIASAQKVAQVEIRAKSANVLSHPLAGAEVTMVVAQGTVLEVLDKDDNWYWVLLPPDAYGTRRQGWVHAHDVEKESPTPAKPAKASHEKMVAAAAAPKPDRQAKARQKSEAEEAARLDKLKQRVDAARRELDAVSKSPAASSSAPAAPATSTTTAPASVTPAPAPVTPTPAPAPVPPPAGTATAPKPPSPSKTQPARIPEQKQPGTVSNARYEAFGGYSFFRDQTSGVNYPAGWLVSLGRTLSNRLDLVGAFAGSHRTESVPLFGDATANVFTFVGGPRYVRRTGSVMSFGQMLAGVETTHASLLGVSDSLTGFALVPGAGVDVPVKKNFAVRFGADLEWVRAGGQSYGEFRISTGLLFATGPR